MFFCFALHCVFRTIKSMHAFYRDMMVRSDNDKIVACRHQVGSWRSRRSVNHCRETTSWHCTVTGRWHWWATAATELSRCRRTAERLSHRHSRYFTLFNAQKLTPRVGSGIERINPLCLLAGCRKRQLNQALSVLSLSLGFFWACLLCC